jgi:hypothetical protein
VKSTDTGRHTTNIAHSKRLESPTIITRKGNKIPMEQKAASVSPRMEKKNKIINPIASPVEITSKYGPILFLKIELAPINCMVPSKLKHITLVYFLMVPDFIKLLS